MIRRCDPDHKKIAIFKKRKIFLCTNAPHSLHIGRQEFLLFNSEPDLTEKDSRSNVLSLSSRALA